MMNLTMLLAEGEQSAAGGFAQSWPMLLVLVLFLALKLRTILASITEDICLIAEDIFLLLTR